MPIDQLLMLLMCRFLPSTPVKLLKSYFKENKVGWGLEPLSESKYKECVNVAHPHVAASALGWTKSLKKQ